VKTIWYKIFGYGTVIWAFLFCFANALFHEKVVSRCKEIPTEGNIDDVERTMKAIYSRSGTISYTPVGHVRVISYFVNPLSAEIPHVWIEEKSGKILAVVCEESYRKYSKLWVTYVPSEADPSVPKFVP